MQQWDPSTESSPVLVCPALLPPCAPVFELSAAAALASRSKSLLQASQHPNPHVLSACYLLALVLLHQVPQAPLLIFQPLPLPQHTLQLLPQVADEILKNRLQVSPGGRQDVLLQQLPLGGQHFVLLLQQPDLGKEEMQESSTPLILGKGTSGPSTSRRKK